MLKKAILVVAALIATSVAVIPIAHACIPFVRRYPCLQYADSPDHIGYCVELACY